MSRSTVTERAQLLFLIISIFFGSIAANAQGGKAEPKPIRFAPNSSSATVTGTLSNGQEYDFVFTAKEGQTVTIANSRTNLFEIRVLNQEFEREIKFVSSRNVIFAVPETGDYMLFIRKKMAKAPRTGRFSITLTIK